MSDTVETVALIAWIAMDAVCWTACVWMMLHDKSGKP